jgi:hypothetical protein
MASVSGLPGYTFRRSLASGGTFFSILPIFPNDRIPPDVMAWIVSHFKERL